MTNGGDASPVGPEARASARPNKSRHPPPGSDPTSTWIPRGPTSARRDRPPSNAAGAGGDEKRRAPEERRAAVRTARGGLRGGARSAASRRGARSDESLRGFKKPATGVT
jgi:hypothetical protein